MSAPETRPGPGGDPVAGRAGMRGRSFRALLGFTGCCFAGYSLLLPVVPLWVSTGGSGALGAGLSTGVFMLVTVLTQPAVPGLVRRVGYRRLVAAGLLLLGGPAPALSWSPALGPVLGLSAVRGVGFGLLTVAGSAMVAELVHPAELGRASARYGLAIGLPQLALLPLGAGAVPRLGFTAVLVAGALPLLALLAVPLIRVPAGSAGTDSGVGGQDGTRAGRRTPERGRGGTRGPLSAMVAGAIAQGGVVTFVPLAHPEPGRVVPLALLALAAGGLVGRTVAGQLADHRDLVGRLMGPGIACATAGMLLEVVAAAGPPSMPVPAGPALVVGALLVGAGFGLVQNDSLVVLFATAGPARYGWASAVWNIGYDGGTGLGATGLGAVAQLGGYPGAFGVGAAVLALTAVVNRLPGGRPRPPVARPGDPGPPGPS